jgi:hypothetical protein
LYDATEFNAYQQLGAASVLDAARHCAPPLAWVPAPAPEISRPAGDGLASRLGIAEKEMA